MRTQSPRLPVPDEVLLRRFGLVRAAGGAAYFAGVAVLLGIFGSEAWPLALGIPVLAVVTTAYYKRSHTYPRASVAGSLVADALVLGAGVAFLGGTGSGLVMLYGIVVVSAGILLGPVGAYSFAAFSVVLGAAQLGLEELGVEPALLHRPELSDRVPILLVSLAGVASIGYLSAIYASRLHDLVAVADEEAASAEERSRRRRSFARQASLDVRGPLTRLEQIAAALEGDVDVPDHADRAELAGRLRREITTLDGEIGQLADVGVLDLAEVRLEPVLLRGVVDDCLRVLGERLAGHELVVDVGDVKVLADRRAVRRVVVNLLENVAEHTPPGTRASITTVGDAGHGVLVVSDDGPGVEPAAAAALFDPPSQPQAPTADQETVQRAGDSDGGQKPADRGGARRSLGLPLVAELCAAMGARVRYEPADPSGGARFLVSFRLAPAAAPSADDNATYRVP